MTEHREQQRASSRWRATLRQRGGRRDVLVRASRSRRPPPARAAASITVASNGSGSPQTLAVNGTGVRRRQFRRRRPRRRLAIEYYHASFDHYFITHIADEITKLDNGTFVGWTRTGRSFKVYPNAVSGLNAVCRFFSTAFDPKSSHFYTPNAAGVHGGQVEPELDVRGRGVLGHVSRRSTARARRTPSPVYRVYNNGQGARAQPSLHDRPGRAQRRCSPTAGSRKAPGTSASSCARRSSALAFAAARSDAVPACGPVASGPSPARRAWGAAARGMQRGVEFQESCAASTALQQPSSDRSVPIAVDASPSLRLVLAVVVGPPAPRPSRPPTSRNGQKVYNNICAQCHNTGGSPGPGPIRLGANDPSVDRARARHGARDGAVRVAAEQQGHRGRGGLPRRALRRPAAAASPQPDGRRRRVLPRGVRSLLRHDDRRRDRQARQRHVRRLDAHGAAVQGVHGAAAGTVAVCRFFSTSFAPKSSHFYTASPSECTAVKANPDWTFEAEVFFVVTARGATARARPARCPSIACTTTGRARRPTIASHRAAGAHADARAELGAGRPGGGSRCACRSDADASAGSSTAHARQRDGPAHVGSVARSMPDSSLSVWCRRERQGWPRPRGGPTPPAGFVSGPALPFLGPSVPSAATPSHCTPCVSRNARRRRLPAASRSSRSSRRPRTAATPR